MANYLTQNVIADLGSEEVKQLITSYNALLDAVGDLITGMTTAADTAAINTLATTAETALVANVKIIAPKPVVPSAPVRPTF